MIFFLIFAAESVVYGIDVGTNGIRIGVGSAENGIGIQPGLWGQRFTPNVFGYCTDEETMNKKWEFGFDVVICKRTMKGDFVTNPFSYLIRPEEFPFKEIHPLCAVSIMLNRLVPQFVPKNDKIILSIPSYSTPQYRYMLQEAFQLARIENFEIIDQSTSIVSLYSVEHLNKTLKKPMDVLFIDIGANHCEFNLWKLSSISSSVTAKQTDFFYTDKISGNIIDDLIYQGIESQFPRQPNSDEKSFILSQVKKAKEILLFEENTTIDLMGLFNTYIDINKDQVAKIVSGLMEKFGDILKQFSNLDSIEFVGSGSKFWMFNNTLKSVLPNVIAKRSLNNDDSIATGTVYYGALELRLVYGMKIAYEKNSLYGYKVIKGQKSMSLLDSGFPSKMKIVSVLEKDCFEFSLEASLSDAIIQKVNIDSIHHMFPFATFSVIGFDKIKKSWEGKLVKEEFFINITFDYNPEIGAFGVIQAKGSNSVENGNGGSSIKIWTFPFNVQLNGIKYLPPVHSPTIVSESIQYIKAKGKKITPYQELIAYYVDALEKSIYDSDYEYVTPNEERKQISLYLQEIASSFNSKLNKSTISKLFSSLKMKVRGPIMRTDERKERPNSITLLKSSIFKAEEELPKATTDEVTVQKFKEYLESTKQWLESASKTERYSNPIITCQDIVRRANTLMKKISDLYGPAKTVTHFRTAPPITPPPEEPKDEPKLEENKDL